MREEYEKHRKDSITNHYLLLTVRINAVPVKAFDMIVRNLPNSEQLPTKELLCIFQDSEGYMWYGTEGGGLCRDDGYTVKVFRSDSKIRESWKTTV